jgi:arylsulfatase A-like enzyme
MKISKLNLSLLLFLFLEACKPQAEFDKYPNIIFVLADDLGYGDLGCYGNVLHRTPNIDKLASEGLKFTDFYAAASVCTPTRAAFLTGCYPRRVSMHRDSKNHCVLIPGANKGLNPDELTLAEVLKSKGYATGCFGKWHLGDQKAFLPLNQGFDVYYGVPYSNDMASRQRGDPPLPLVYNNDVLIAPVEQDLLTKLCTDKALEFITIHSQEPFFVYIPFNMPHNPVHASVTFRGKSANGIYGDAVEEMDYSVGRIISLLDSLNIYDNTIFIFTSDNGAAKPFGGSNLPLTGWKGSNFEGGFRVPCVIKWTKSNTPGREVNSFTKIMDFLPTFAKLVDYELPVNKTIDGRSMLDLIRTGKDIKLVDREFYYYYRDQLQAVRKGEWKLFLPLDILQTQWDTILKEGQGQDMKLINLRIDLQEQNDLSEEYPDKLEELMKLADKVRMDLGDNDSQGENQRPAGWIDNPQYLKLNK